MADYERTTVKTTLERLPEATRAALSERIETALLSIPDGAPAFLTQSRRVRKGGLLSRMTGSADADTEHDTAFVLGPRDLLVATHGERRGTAVLSARLEDLEVGSLMPQLAGDGMDVTGFAVSGPDGGPGTYHIGLGPPDGDGARAALEDAIRAAKA